MKNLTLILLILTSLNTLGQYSHDKPLNQQPEFYAPSAVLVAGFTLNESLMRSESFQNLPDVEQYQIATKVYLSSAILSLGTYFVVKYVQKNKRKIKRRFKR